MSLPAQQIRFCTSRDGARIAYATCGAGPPLVWAGSWTHHLELDWDSAVWRPWIDMLTRRHTLVRYDWRGCGLSDREQVEFSFEKYVEDLEAVTGAADPEQFVLFGVAAGAAIGMAYAVRHPKRVTPLVLYSSYVRNRLAGSPTPQEVEEAQARLKVIELGWPNDTPAYGQFFAGLIPGARFVPLESRNHVLLDTEPAWRQFVEAVDDFLAEPTANATRTGRLALDELTAREHQVLELVAQGIDNTSIGERLHISERTARNHVSTILGKLGVNTRAQAIVRAREAGFGSQKVR